MMGDGVGQGWMAVFLGLALAGPAAAQDADGDGWTVDEGDCDDADDRVSPGYADEICGDLLDNECDGYYDDGCDLSVRQGSLRGGGGCSGGQAPEPAPTPTPTGTVAVLGLPLLGLLRGRRT